MCRARALLSVLTLAVLLLPPPAALAEDGSTLLQGRLDDGALWRIRTPQHWNGALLLYSHGYVPAVQPPQLAPRGMEDWLLAQGYALAASSYARPGWALAEAVPDQLQTLAIFRARIARPATTIAWGDSMGGLVSVALAEDAAAPIDGALSSCGSIAGSVTMMNIALDGAAAFVTLAAPGAGIRIVGVDDDRENAGRVARALAQALTTPQGRARVALAGVLAGLPVWTQPDAPEPLPADFEGQLQQMSLAFAAGVFPPRTDQEQRAGGITSWNVGEDYRQALARTQRRAWVEHFYRAAHLDLDEDLRRLDAAPRIAGQPGAVAYLRAHYVPTAQPLVPLLSLHTLGDGLTTPLLQSVYAAAVPAQQARNFRALWVHAAGHCAFTPAEYAAALATLQSRLAQGRWDIAAARVNARAEHSGLGPARFVTHRATGTLRQCLGPSARCVGAPAA